MVSGPPAVSSRHMSPVHGGTGESQYPPKPRRTQTCRTGGGLSEQRRSTWHVGSSCTAIATPHGCALSRVAQAALFCAARGRGFWHSESANTTCMNVPTDVPLTGAWPPGAKAGEAEGLLVGEPVPVARRRHRGAVAAERVWVGMRVVGVAAGVLRRRVPVLLVRHRNAIVGLVLKGRNVKPRGRHGSQPQDAASRASLGSVGRGTAAPNFPSVVVQSPSGGGSSGWA